MKLKSFNYFWPILAVLGGLKEKIIQEIKNCGSEMAAVIMTPSCHVAKVYRSTLAKYFVLDRNGHTFALYYSKRDA